MSTILVIDGVAIFRELISAALRAEGYQTCCADSGAAGLSVVRSHGPDLILLELSLPVLDGMGFLRALRRDASTAQTPVIVLTGATGKGTVYEAGKLGVRDYLLKSHFSLGELRDRIKRRLAPERMSIVPSEPVATQPARMVDSATTGPAPSEPATRLKLTESALVEAVPLLTSAQCKHRVEASMAGKTLSGAVADVMMLAGRPSAELKDLAALITRDPVLSVRVLQTANSAAFASRRGSVTTISEAVRNIGATNVRNLAASVGVFDAMPASSPDGFNPIRCWQHSFAVARLCEAFTAPTAPDEAGVAYLVGLCHDLGEIMFRTQFEQEYKSVLNFQQCNGPSIEEIESTLLGMTRQEILKVIMKCMGLPEGIRDPIERFQKSAKLPADQPTILRALGMAETYANGLLLASSPAALVAPFTAREWALLSGPIKPSVPNGEELRAQIYCLTAILSRLNASDQAELIKLPCNKPEKRVWLARDPSFAKVDPVAEALGALATVQVHDRLPSAEEMLSHQAIIVESAAAKDAAWSEQQVRDLQKASLVKVPLLWLTSDRFASVGDGCESPARSISIQTLHDFAGRVIPASQRIAA